LYGFISNLLTNTATPAAQSRSASARAVACRAYITRQGIKSTPSKGQRDLELQYHVVIPLRSAVTVHEDNSLSALPCSYYAHAPRKAIVHGCTGTCQTELILIAFAAHHTGWTYTAASTTSTRVSVCCGIQEYICVHVTGVCT